MIIEMDFNSEEALYLQLCNQIIQGIAMDHFHEGDSLPSVRQLADTYRNFAKKHRELYWLIMTMSAKDKRVRDDAAVLFTDPLKKMLEDFHLKEEESIHYRRLFRAIVHGFVSQEEQGFFSHYPAAVDDSFHFAVQCYIESLKQGEKRCS